MFGFVVKKKKKVSHENAEPVASAGEASGPSGEAVKETPGVWS